MVMVDLLGASLTRAMDTRCLLAPGDMLSLGTSVLELGASVVELGEALCVTHIIINIYCWSHDI